MNFEDTVSVLKCKLYFSKLFLKLRTEDNVHTVDRVKRMYIFPFIRVDIIEHEKYNEIIIETHLIRNYKKIISFKKNGIRFKECYYKGDKFHRLDGPAIIYYNQDGSIKQELYYIKDILYKDELQYIIKADSYSKKQIDVWKNFNI